MFALPIFLGRPGIVLPQKVSGGHFLAEKSPDISVEAFVFALPIFPGRPTYCRGVGTVRWTVPATSIIVEIKEKNQTEVWFFVFALPIFPGSHPPSIVGVHELNFCVRNGNRWTLMTINTNSKTEAFPLPI